MLSDLMLAVNSRAAWFAYFGAMTNRLLEAIKNAIKNEPVRVYTITAAVLALVCFYVSIPVVLFLAVVGAVTGVGVTQVRNNVTPEHRAVQREQDAASAGIDLGLALADFLDNMTVADLFDQDAAESA